MNTIYSLKAVYNKEKRDDYFYDLTPLLRKNHNKEYISFIICDGVTSGGGGRIAATLTALTAKKFFSNNTEFTQALDLLTEETYKKYVDNIFKEAKESIVYFTQIVSFLKELTKTKKKISQQTFNELESLVSIFLEKIFYEEEKTQKIRSILEKIRRLGYQRKFEEILEELMNYFLFKPNSEIADREEIKRRVKTFFNADTFYCGTTAIMVFSNGKRVFIAHTGDGYALSMQYLLSISQAQINNRYLEPVSLSYKSGVQQSFLLPTGLDLAYIIDQHVNIPIMTVVHSLEPTSTHIFVFGTDGLNLDVYNGKGFQVLELYLRKLFDAMKMRYKKLSEIGNKSRISLVVKQDLDLIASKYLNFLKNNDLLEDDTTIGLLFLGSESMKKFLDPYGNDGGIKVELPDMTLDKAKLMKGSSLTISDSDNRMERILKDNDIDKILIEIRNLQKSIEGIQRGSTLSPTKPLDIQKIENRMMQELGEKISQKIEKAIRDASISGSITKENYLAYDLKTVSLEELNKFQAELINGLGKTFNAIMKIFALNITSNEKARGSIEEIELKLNNIKNDINSHLIKTSNELNNEIKATLSELEKYFRRTASNIAIVLEKTDAEIKLNLNKLQSNIRSLEGLINSADLQNVRFMLQKINETKRIMETLQNDVIKYRSDTQNRLNTITETTNELIEKLKADKDLLLELNVSENLEIFTLDINLKIYPDVLVWEEKRPSSLKKVKTKSIRINNIKGGKIKFMRKKEEKSNKKNNKNNKNKKNNKNNKNKHGKNNTDKMKFDNKLLIAQVVIRYGLIKKKTFYIPVNNEQKEEILKILKRIVPNLEIVEEF